jgi:hypothetical protein
MRKSQEHWRILKRYLSGGNHTVFVCVVTRQILICLLVFRKTKKTPPTDQSTAIGTEHYPSISLTSRTWQVWWCYSLYCAKYTKSRFVFSVVLSYMRHFVSLQRKNMFLKEVFMIVTMKTAGDMTSCSVAEVLRFRTIFMPLWSRCINSRTLIMEVPESCNASVYFQQSKKSRPQNSHLQKILNMFVVCWSCVHIMPHIP